MHLRSGRIGGSCRIPELLMHYWNDKANQVAASLASMSTRQVDRIDEVFASTDPDQLANSETFRAMNADVQFSGDQAFRVTGRGPKDDAG